MGYAPLAQSPQCTLDEARPVPQELPATIRGSFARSAAFSQMSEDRPFLSCLRVGQMSIKIPRLALETIGILSPSSSKSQQHAVAGKTYNLEDYCREKSDSREEWKC